MSPQRSPAPMACWLVDGMHRDVSIRLERLRASEGIDRIVVLPDVHLSQTFCIGTVVASGERLYPGAVGGDIGCGMAAIRFDVGAHDALATEAAAERVFRLLRRLVPVTRHGRRTMRDALPDELTDPALSAGGLISTALRDGRVQLGTVGGGNHFVELQSDDEGWLWLMVHSGSRAVGQAVATHHLRGCEGEGSRLRWLPADSESGQAYLEDVAWARAYAHRNRMDMVDAVAAIVGELFGAEPDEASLIACDHNHVQHEEHEGSLLWVHRKGALAAGHGEPGLVPGSMGTESFHTEGRGLEEALCSSSHGAGRALSRSEARDRISTREFTRQMKGVWFDRRAANRLRDEAPAAYKNVRAVMKAQRDLTRIVRRVRPLLVYKG